jgi:hypothetical protein
MALVVYPLWCIGFVLFFWIITPILYYTNVWNLSYFPMAASIPFDRFGKPYDITRVLTSDSQFNLTAYEHYSPLYLPASYAMTYCLALALFTCVIVHTALYHGRSLWCGIKRLKIEPDDIHAKLMSHYTEVPDWWYLSVFVVFFGIAIVSVEVFFFLLSFVTLLKTIFLVVRYGIQTCQFGLWCLLSFCRLCMSYHRVSFLRCRANL